MAIIDVSVPMKSIAGIEIIKKDSTGKDVGSMTLKDVCIESLLGIYEDERNLSGEEKVKRFILAKKIMETKNGLELSSEEIVLIKTLCAKAYSALIVGQVFEILK